MKDIFNGDDNSDKYSYYYNPFFSGSLKHTICQFNKKTDRVKMIRFLWKVQLPATRKVDEIIEILANLIDNKVNLKNPDKIVMVQILGDYTGISIIDPEDIISIPKIIAQK